MVYTSAGGAGDGAGDGDGDRGSSSAAASLASFSAASMRSTLVLASLRAAAPSSM